MKLTCLSIAWIVGVFIGSLIRPPLYAVVAGWALVLVIVLLWRRRTLWLWGGLCLSVVLSGMGWYQLATDVPNLQGYCGRRVMMEGKVARDSQCSDGGAWLGFSAEWVSVGDCREPASGKVVVYTDPVSSYSQGDVLKIRGEIEPLSEITNPGYRSFLERQGYVGTVNESAEIELLRRSWLFGFRDRLAQSISNALAEPQSSLAEGLLLGIRSHMPDELRDDFSKTGTSHLLAISGFNLAVIGGVVLGAAAWVFGRQRPFYILATLIIVWLYSALTGMQPPVMRSAIMFSLLLAALWLGRPGGAMPALCLAGAIMVGIDTKVLWDVSFQLSFAAVAGLIVIQPPLQQRGDRVIPDGLCGASIMKPIFNSFAVGLAAILATMPLMVYYFQSFSLVGLPATVVASAFVTAATMLAGATAALGLLLPPVAWVFGWVASFFLMCIVATVEWFARLPFASVETGSISSAIVWAYYLALIGLVYSGRLRSVVGRPLAVGGRCLDGVSRVAWRLPKKRTAGVLVVCGALVWVGFVNLPGTELQVSFLDVGQGDAILIETPSGQQILIDGGPNPDTACQQVGDKLPFWDKSLDVVVLTHSDDDHLVGLMGILECYQVSHVIESGYGEGPIYRQWLKTIAEKGIDWNAVSAGEEIDLGEGIALQVIYPYDELLEDTDSKVNSNSVVLRLAWGKVSFLLTGDADDKAEQAILYGGVMHDLGSTVLKAGHHGSKYSTSPDFLAAVDPEVAVISVGEGNTFGHPSEETLARLAGVDVYRTDECGTVTFTTDGERLWVEMAKTPGA